MEPKLLKSIFSSFYHMCFFYLLCYSSHLPNIPFMLLDIDTVGEYVTHNNFILESLTSKKTGGSGRGGWNRRKREEERKLKTVRSGPWLSTVYRNHPFTTETVVFCRLKIEDSLVKAGYPYSYSQTKQAYKWQSCSDTNTGPDIK